MIDKHNEENYLYNFVHSFHKKLLIARLGNVYGDIKNKGIVNNIFNSILNNTKLEIRGDGNQKRDFIFVDDVANLIVKLIFTEQKEEKVVYNICSGISSSINNLIYEIEFLLNTKIDYHYIDFEFEKCDVICNNKKILDLLGKNYMFSNLSIGLKKTAKRYGLKKRF